MLNNFELHNIYGSFYKSGHAIFHPKTNLLYSPINNQVKVIDLHVNTTSVLNFECAHNIHHIVIDPQGIVLIAVDRQGYAVLYNLKAFFIIAHFSFKGKVKNIKFSPDGRLLAVGQEKGFRIYEAPSFWRTFEPLLLLKKYNNRHTEKITSINFSPDSRFLMTSGAENKIYMNNILPIKDYIANSFDVHKYKIIATFFNAEMTFMYSVDSGGNVYVWKWVEDYLSEGYQKMLASKKRKLQIQLNRNGNRQVKEEEEKQDNKVDKSQYSEFEKRVTNGRFIMSKKLIISQPGSHVKRVEYLPQIGLLASCYSNGKFSVFKLELQTLLEIHSFAVGEQNKISTLSVNSVGSWICLGIEATGQLVVWEWKSQTYIFNQTGLVHDITTAAYSPNNSLVAVGSHEGKIKLWDRKSGFCFATFEQHEGSVTDVKFSNQNTLFSCSNDGTVNAYDTVKYKRFRVLKPDNKCQLTTLAIDPSGEIICAGAFDPYEVYSWNLQTGHLLQVVRGHTAPISCIQFAGDNLVTGSWDRSIRIYDFFSRKTNNEALDHGSEITAMSVHPDSTQIAVATLKGEVYLWKVSDCQIIGILDCRKDLRGGRKELSRVSSQNDANTKHIRSLQYSACGEYLVAGGRSKYVLIYDIKHRLLLKRIAVTTNKDIDGVMDRLNSRKIKEGININEIEVDDSEEQINNNYLPGAKKFDVSKRSKKIDININKVLISNNNKEFAVATNFGVLLYSQSKKFSFSPYQLLPNLTPGMIIDLMKQKQVTAALTVALKLNLPVEKLLTKIHIKHVSQVLNELSNEYAVLLLQKLANVEVDERRLIWITGLVKKVDIDKVPKGLISNLSKLSLLTKIVNQNLASLELARIWTH